MFKKSIKLMSCIGILFFLSTVTIFGQKSKCAPEKDSNGAIIPNRFVCEISESDPYPLGPVRIPNNAKVVIRMVKKSPFDECTLSDIKLTPIVEPDPIEKMLIIFSKAFGGLPAGGVNMNPTLLTYPAPPTYLGNTLAEKLGNKAVNLGIDVKNALLLMKVVRARQELLLKNLNNFVLYPPRNRTEFENNMRDENEIRIKSGTVLISDLFTELNRTDEFEAELKESQYNSIRKQLEGLTDPIVADILSDLDEIRSDLTKLKSGDEVFSNARALFKSTYKTLKEVQDTLNANNPMKDPFSKEFPAFLPYSQQAASSSVTCTNTITKKVVYNQIPVTFLYKKDSRLSVSVGPLFSTGSKQKLGITQINTGLNPMGQPSFRNEFAVVDKASYQIIPFAFLNYRLMYLGNNSNPTKPSDFSLNISGGIGVNPNSGTNEVEYFIGPSLGYKKFLFQFGDHIGRFQKGFTGGFNIGDTVPASFPTTLPIQKEYRHRFGIGISYRLF